MARVELWRPTIPPSERPTDVAGLWSRSRRGVLRRPDLMSEVKASSERADVDRAKWPGAPPASAAPLRILHVITGLNVGGAETVLCRLVERMDISSYELGVVSLMGTGPLRARLVAAGAGLEELDLRAGADANRGGHRLPDKGRASSAARAALRVDARGQPGGSLRRLEPGSEVSGCLERATDL